MSSPLQLVQKSHITFYSPTKVASLKQPVNSLVQASYSTVLTMANFILYHHPTLMPPNSNSFQIKDNVIDSQFPQVHLTFNKLYEPWCDYLSQLILSNKVTQKQDVCFFQGQVNEEFIMQLQSTLFQIHERQPQQSLPAPAQPKLLQETEALQKNSSIGSEKKKKIAIINFATSQLREDLLQPKMHLLGLFAGIFYHQNDQWKIYNTLKRHYPSDQEYKQLDTVILSGSSMSVNDDTPQVLEFIQTLRQGIIINPNLKILGVCFGHQALAKMFGGKIVQKQLLTGVETIDFDQKLMHQTPYFRRSQLDQNTFELSEYHKDFVVEIPQNFTIFAKSSTCKIESLISKNKKYLSFQFHPQYSAEYIKAFEMRNQHYQIFDLKSAYSHKQRGSIRHDSSLWEIRKVIRNFIDWNAQEDKFVPV